MKKIEVDEACVVTLILSSVLIMIAVKLKDFYYEELKNSEFSLQCLLNQFNWTPKPKDIKVSTKETTRHPKPLVILLMTPSVDKLFFSTSA